LFPDCFQLFFLDDRFVSGLFSAIFSGRAAVWAWLGLFVSVWADFFSDRWQRCFMAMATYVPTYGRIAILLV
jgi:hypothetical protein